MSKTTATVKKSSTTAAATNNGLIEMGRTVNLKLMNTIAGDVDNDRFERERRLRNVLAICYELFEMKNHWFFKENILNSLRTSKLIGLFVLFVFVLYSIFQITTHC
jgi:hypothetical protein